jgi:hypothetical protein
MGPSLTGPVPGYSVANSDHYSLENELKRVALRFRTPIELVYNKRGGVARGDPKARSIKLRTPLTCGSNDRSATLKSTCQAKST